MWCSSGYGIAMSGGFIVSELRSLRPMLHIHLVRVEASLISSVITTSANASFQRIVLLAPTYLREKRVCLSFGLAFLPAR
ncbi:MAG TPA: hypothetical protein VMU99_01145 [Acidimicrobiales bacterium]|nr:hypothetical protein [Acidimicrobiales bacterium]